MLKLEGERITGQQIKGGINNNGRKNFKSIKSAADTTGVSRQSDNRLLGQSTKSINHVFQDLHINSDRHYSGFGKWEFGFDFTEWLDRAVRRGRYLVSAALTYDSFSAEVPQVVV